MSPRRWSLSLSKCGLCLYSSELYSPKTFNEESAFRVAWSAVKRDYEKGEDGQWHKKPAT
ncbi:ChaB family protein [Nostoc sp. FACHB-110]|nr:ChaB family protein [Nostoc sp. FACHB-110]